MKIRKAGMEDREEALLLAEKEYEEEASVSKVLSIISEKEAIKDSLLDLFTELLENGYFYVAYEEETLLGYLGFFGPWNGLVGNVKGAFSPLGGSAFTGEDRAKISSMVLAYAMDEMAKDGVLSFALSRYAHDTEVGKSLVLNGFGIRCSDAAKSIVDFDKQTNTIEGISYCEMEKQEFQQVLELNRGLTAHLLKAPVFLPADLNVCFPDYKVGTDCRLFVAKAGDQEKKIIGFIKVGDDGENIISELPCMKNICGAYVHPDYRNHLIAEGLLYYVIEQLKKEGVSYLGVDCETLNPTALRFWGKYFENYTYSYARRLDERIVGFEAYEEKIWKDK